MKHGHEDDYAEAMERYYAAANPEVQKCKWFGCGRTLTGQENMAGKYCMIHQNAKVKIVMQKENLYTPDCIRTVSGKYVNVFEPDPETICIEDIAHALSMQCRFGGHLPQFYSVAQHSIFCADLADADQKLAALLHDASEAYMLDIPKPIKLKLANYGEIEDGLMKLIAAKFGFAYPLSDHIKLIDKRMLHMEWNAIMLEKKNNLEVYSTMKAKTFFLNKFKELSV